MAAPPVGVSRPRLPGPAGAMPGSEKWIMKEPMTLGVRAHDFGRLPAGELARRIAAQGFSSVQLAPTKALAGFDRDEGRLSPGFACRVRQAFERQGLQIAVLGCYINLADPDAGRRGHQLARFKEYLRFAREFGCSVVGTETGSVNPDYSFHPQNRGEEAFQTVREAVKELVAEAERFGVVVGIEAVERYVVSDPGRMQRLLDEVGSQNLQVIFDPVNLLSAENHDRQDEVVTEALGRWGDRIAIVHAKDFVVSGGRIQSVVSGRGLLHHQWLVDFVRTRKPYINVLMEDTGPETVAEGVQFLRGLFAEPPAV